MKEGADAPQNTHIPAMKVDGYVITGRPIPRACSAARKPEVGNGSNRTCAAAIARITFSLSSLEFGLLCKFLIHLAQVTQSHKQRLIYQASSDIKNNSFSYICRKPSCQPIDIELLPG